MNVQQASEAPSIVAGTIVPFTPPAARLTPTQLKVMDGVRSGLLNKQIAYDLGIAEATVKAHMTALMRKLNVRNRTQVAVAAQAMGYDQRLAR
ncbi:LuxR C-terminal-related transcriptional regulator [uncultured Sphingomonas sp.]|uniref:helix-turn-helix domain-containing protein n=1 Tax=uncultured Sphingomonas sp. TaxID=158754 RepID=UPI0025F518F7|nr:LuxR C-terminal-related transcriptional regulator [uncultured Sphingomonas sp.]